MGRPGLRLFQPGPLPSEAPRFPFRLRPPPSRPSGPRRGAVTRLRSSEEREAGLLPGPPLPPTLLSQGAGAGKFLLQPRGEPPRALGSCSSASYLSPGASGAKGPRDRSVGARPAQLGGRPGCLERRRRLGFLPAHLLLIQLCCRPSPVTCDAPGLRPFGSVPRLGLPFIFGAGTSPISPAPKSSGLCHPSSAPTLNNTALCAAACLSSTPEFYASAGLSFSTHKPLLPTSQPPFPTASDLANSYSSLKIRLTSSSLEASPHHLRQLVAPCFRNLHLRLLQFSNTLQARTLPKSSLRSLTVERACIPVTCVHSTSWDQGRS